MGIRRWRDEPVNLTIEIERVSLEDLPALINDNSELDKQIAEILKSEIQEKYYWIKDSWGKRVISTDLNNFFNNIAKNGETAEIEIEATSTGYADPGKTSGPPDDCYPPEEEDEREVQSVKITFYDEDGEPVVTNELINFCTDLFEREFSEEIDDVEIDID